MATAMTNKYDLMGITPHQNSEMKYSQGNSESSVAEENIHLPNNVFPETKTKLPTIEQLAMLGVTISEIANIYDKTVQTMYKFVENNEVAYYGKAKLNQYQKTAIYSLADFVLKIGNKWPIDTDAMTAFINSFGNNVDENYTQKFIYYIRKHNLEIENKLHEKMLKITRDFVTRDIDVYDLEDAGMVALRDLITEKDSQIEKLNSKIKGLESILEKQTVSVTPKVNVKQNDSQKLDIGLSIDITVNGKKIDIK